MKLHLPVSLARLVCLAAVCQTQAADVRWNIINDETRIISASTPLEFPTDGNVIKTGPGILYLTQTANPAEGVLLEEAHAASSSEFAGDIYVNEGHLRFGYEAIVDGVYIGDDYYVSPDALGRTGTIHVGKGAELSFCVTQNSTVDIYKSISLEGGCLSLKDGYNILHGGLSLTADSTLYSEWGNKPLTVNGLNAAGCKLDITTTHGSLVQFTGSVRAEHIAVLNDGSSICKVIFDRDKGLTSLSLNNLSLGNVCEAELNVSENGTSFLRHVTMGSGALLRTIDGNYHLNTLTLSGDAEIKAGHNKSLGIDFLAASEHTLTITRENEGNGTFNVLLNGGGNAGALVLNGDVTATLGGTNTAFNIGSIQLNNGATLRAGDGSCTMGGIILVCNAEGKEVASIGASGAGYKNITLSSAGISGDGEGGVIDCVSIVVSGSFVISDTTLMDSSISEQKNAALTLSNVSLGGGTSLNITHADAGGTAPGIEGYTLLNSATLSGATLSGSLGISLAADVLNSYASSTRLAISLEGLSGADLTVASFSVSDAVVQKFGVVDSVSTTPTGVLLYLADGENLTWEGGSGVWNMSNAHWSAPGGQTGCSYSNGAYVTFAHGSSTSSITLDEAVEARRVMIVGGRYAFSGGALLTIGKDLVLQSANGVAAVASFNEAPVFAAGAGITLADAASSLTIARGNVSVDTFHNKGTVTLRNGSLSVDSAVTNGGLLEVASLSLAASSSNSFTRLVSTGSVSYSGAAGSLSVGDNSRIGSLSGGALEVTNGSVFITGSSLTSLETLSGAGSLTLNGSLELTGASALAGNLSVAGTLSLEASLSLGGDLAATSVRFGQVAQTPLLQATGLSGSSVDFELSASGAASLQGLSLTSGQSCTLVSLANGAGETVFTIEGGDSILLGQYHYTISEDAASHDIILTAEFYDASSWSSTDGVWDTAADCSGHLPGADDTLALLGEGSSEVLLPGDRSVGCLDVEHQREFAYRLTGDSLSAGAMNVRRGGLELANESTTVAGSIIVETRGSLVVAAGSRLEAADMLLEGEREFHNAGTITLAGALRADESRIVNTGVLSVGSGDTTIGSLESSTGEFNVAAGGEVRILGDSSIGKLSNSGRISMPEWDLVLSQATQEGGKLQLKNLTLAGGDNAFGNLEAVDVMGNTGTLELGDASVISGELMGGGALSVSGEVMIQKVAGTLDSLSIRQGGCFSTGSDLTVSNSFASHGSLNAADNVLTFASPVAQGGDVSARELTLHGSGNSFEHITVSALTFAGPLAADCSLLHVSSLSSATQDGISITLAETGGAFGRFQLVDSDAALSLNHFSLSQEFIVKCQAENVQPYLECGADGGLYLKIVERYPDYYANYAESENAKAAALLVEMNRRELHPGADTDIGKLIASLENAIASGASVGQFDSVFASVGGASIPTLSLALAGDVHRQLRSIRNRTTTMGVDNRYEHPEMPYVNAWINAEGDYREMEDDGTAAGYSLSSWGGTVGVDVDMAENLTLGFACTALYGDFSATGADDAEGDMDSYYASFFARLAQRRWVHTFVMTAGFSDISLDRTVSHAAGSYKTTGSTDGLSLGALYEVAYTVRLSEDDSVCWQPVANVSFVHATVDGYDESGSDAALRAGEQDFTQFTLGLGARLQAVVGENLYNRASILELRALAKVDMGDREGRADIAFASLPGQRVGMSSNEYGAVGVELGAGITIPVSADSGELFFDASAELRGGQSEVSGAAGWRVHF